MARKLPLISLQHHRDQDHSLTKEVFYHKMFESLEAFQNVDASSVEFLKIRIFERYYIVISTFMGGTVTRSTKITFVLVNG